MLDLDRNASSMRENIRIIAEETREAEIVHLWKCYPDIAIPVLWALRTNPRPLHYDWDDLEGGEGGIAHRLTGSTTVASLVSKWEHEILNWADSVSVASEEIERICQSYEFPESSIFFGPVGSEAKDIDEIAIAKWRDTFQGKKVISFLGQMEAEDFPAEVLAGVAAVLQERAELMLVLIGDGDARGALEKETQDLGVANQSLFTGYLSHDEAQAILSLSTAFLFPLKDDKMSRCKSPLVVVEALSHGVPVVGSNVGEVSRMVGDCGVLIEGLNKQDWIIGLKKLLDWTETDSNVSYRTRTHFEQNWTWATSVDNLEKAYHHALRTHQT